MQIKLLKSSEMEHGTRLVMAESTKFFRQKKGQWIWMYNTKTNRRSKIELQFQQFVGNDQHLINVRLRIFA